MADDQHLPSGFFYINSSPNPFEFFVKVGHQIRKGLNFLLSFFPCVLQLLHSEVGLVLIILPPLAR